MVRAKFRVESYETRLSNGKELRTVKLGVVYSNDPDNENRMYWEYTPSGHIELGTVNQAAWEQLPLGVEVYVDFTPVVFANGEMHEGQANV